MLDRFSHDTSSSISCQTKAVQCQVRRREGVERGAKGRGDTFSSVRRVRSAATIFSSLMTAPAQVTHSAWQQTGLMSCVLEWGTVQVWAHMCVTCHAVELHGAQGRDVVQGGRRAPRAARAAAAVGGLGAGLTVFGGGRGHVRAAMKRPGSEVKSGVERGAWGTGVEEGSDLMSKPSTAMDEARGRPLCFVATWERASKQRESRSKQAGGLGQLANYLEADASRALALEAQQLLQPQAPQVAELRLRPAVQSDVGL